MRDNSTIESQLPTIKKEFKISSEESIILEFMADVEDSEPIKNMKCKMPTFKKGTIHINLQIKHSQNNKAINKTPNSISKYIPKVSPLTKQQSKNSSPTLQSDNQELKSEIYRLMTIIDEQRIKIDKLEELLEEKDTKQEDHYIVLPEKQDDETFLILDYDQINNLQKIKI